MASDLKFAVLIDADNVSDKYIKIILDEISNDGVATYKRIYGDWTKPALASWKNVLLDNSILPMQQYNYTTGKNSTDSAMIIDAMDILYSGQVDGFCIVSSDSDFTRLAARLRESGMNVVGMGERKTPKSFISACNRFKYLDILAKAAVAEKPEERPAVKEEPRETKAAKAVKNGLKAVAKSGKAGGQAPEESAQSGALPAGDGGTEAGLSGGKAGALSAAGDLAPSGANGTAARDNGAGAKAVVYAGGGQAADDAGADSAVQPQTDLDTIKAAIRTIVLENSDEDDWISTGTIGSLLVKRYPDFDVRNYGYSKLTPFLQHLNMFDIKSRRAPGGNMKLINVKLK